MSQWGWPPPPLPQALRYRLIIVHERSLPSTTASAIRRHEVAKAKRIQAGVQRDRIEQKRRYVLRAMPATSRHKFFECETQSPAAGTRPSRSRRSAYERPVERCTREDRGTLASRTRLNLRGATMATNPPNDVEQLRSVFRESVSHHWVLFLSEGIALLILGTLAIIVPVLASLAAAFLLGWILLLSGIVGLIATIRARHAPGLWWSLISALVGIVAGALLLGWPLQGAFSLTVVLIAFLILEGIVSILYALEHRRGLSGRWHWMLASGILDLALGGIILAGLPGSAVWALGIIIGINMIFGGWALIAMALAARAHAPGSSA